MERIGLVQYKGQLKMIWYIKFKTCNPEIYFDFWFYLEVMILGYTTRLRLIF